MAGFLFLALQHGWPLWLVSYTSLYIFYKNVSFQGPLTLNDAIHALVHVRYIGGVVRVCMRVCKVYLRARRKGVGALPQNEK